SIRNIGSQPIFLSQTHGLSCIIERKQAYLCRAAGGQPLPEIKAAQVMEVMVFSLQGLHKIPLIIHFPLKWLLHHLMSQWITHLPKNRRPQKIQKTYPRLNPLICYPRKNMRNSLHI
ncbi:hypothetical protein JRQ81_003131, partial [Phrynocephalus forsythii]